MKVAAYLATIPLTDLEKNHLSHVYYTRVKIFCAAYAFFIGFLLRYLFPFSKMSDEELNLPLKRSYDYEVLRHLITKEDMFYILLTVFGGFILITGCMIFFKKVYPYKKDLKYGYKEAILYTITNKLYFEHTNECFFSFNDPKYMHYKVEATLYDVYKIGDEITIYRCKYSKHVFEKDFRFTLM